MNNWKSVFDVYSDHDVQYAHLTFLQVIAL